MKKVRLNDERPYGEAGQCIVILARYESVHIKYGGDSSSVEIALTLALEADTRKFVCAFTDASPRWPLIKPSDPESIVGTRWNITPAHYESVVSSVIDVLEEAWKASAIDPREWGQVIVRPRHAMHLQARRTGEPLPNDPNNAWIVEALGRFIMRRYPPSVGRDSLSIARASDCPGIVLTTHVQLFRDGDLQFMGGTIVP